MSHRALGRQFSSDEVEAHVPGAHDMGENQAGDVYTRQLIPIGNVHERTSDRFAESRTAHIEMEHFQADYADWHGEDEAAGYADEHYNRIDQMAKQPLAANSPIVVSPIHRDGSPTGHYVREDGLHRIKAAVQADPSVTHAVAYVRQRSAW